MKKFMITFMILVMVIVIHSAAGFAAEMKHEGHDMSGSTEMKHEPSAGTFQYEAVQDGVRAEFEVMSLESMNMKDPGGATHHIMVRLYHDSMNHQIKDVVGKIKVIAPSGKDQTETLKNYGGVFAANFTFEEKGKYGVICLVKVEENKYTYKFWYEHP